MEEELNENDLEQRFYAMIYYADDTQTDVQENTKKEDTLQIFENAPRSTIRRYWRTSTSENVLNLKSNTPTEKSPINNNNNVINTKTNIKSSENVSDLPKSIDLSMFQSPIPKDVKKTIEILDTDCAHVVELNSSDEDEVIEVALPPKPTITIESSDDEELKIISRQHSSIKEAKTIEKGYSKPVRRDREVSASPVPSIVSSVSDEFIRGDCIALNISSKHPHDHSFDFSLHGSDLLDHSTPSKKKKKKKSKDRATSTPTDTILTQDKSPNNKTDVCFATPKSKAKNKRQRNKSQLLPEKIIASADFYDSDSNHSTDSKKSRNTYTVTEKSVPSSDVYESDSSQSETHKETISNNSLPGKSNELCINTVPLKDTFMNNTTKTTLNKDPISTPCMNNMTNEWSEGFITVDDTNIDENIVMANVTGFMESDNENEVINVDIQKDIPKLGSTKVPAILNEDLDFDNLKGNSKVCRRKKYSLTALRAEMEKFYNESWGGENFNHREIQKYMSRDKSLWVIDPKDRMPTQYRKKSISCNYCNGPGHRDDICQLKPPICHMCGSTGHNEPRCPRKICLNCGSPHVIYSMMCHNCAKWGRSKCAECGQYGHPSSHCPDIWRRYHNTIDITMPLEESRQTKNYHQLFCCGCTRRGHLVHTCRISEPFSGYIIDSPYVYNYRPIYYPIPEEYRTNKNINPQQNVNKQTKCYNQDSTYRTERNKRQSKSPTVHESHIIKKRNTSEASAEKSQTNGQLKKAIQNKETNIHSVPESIDTTIDVETAPDFIPISSSNHNKKGQIIQDSQVSDSNDVITSARIYVTKEVLDKLKTQEGENWLSEMSNKHNVIFQHMDLNLFLSVKGKVFDQETFQNELRNWTMEKSKKENSKSDSEDVLQEADSNAQSAMSNNIPKNRNNALRKLNKALELLKLEIGDPNVLYKELIYLQNRHLQLLKQNVISPKQVSNNRDNMKEMLKKLNMILIGQAGLADGSKHLTELYYLKEKLTNFRQKNIPIDLRNEIGEHFHCIFAAMPRADYVDLLKNYNISKCAPALMKKKNFRLKRPLQKKKNNSIPPQPKNLNNTNDNEANDFKLSRKNFPQLCGTKPIVKKTIRKLIFYHQRLMHERPVAEDPKKTRLQLVRRLNAYIISLRNGTMHVKTLKKTKKIVKQAQLFLTNL